MEVRILSGLPGSGKSHYTSQLENCRVFSADLFFMKNGEYQFDISKIGEAHAWCFKNFVQALQSLNGPEEILVVDNTNLTAAEIAPYVQAANAYGWSVKVVTIKCDPEVAFKRQTHGVPLGTFMHMFANFRDRKLPPYWRQETVKAG